MTHRFKKFTYRLIQKASMLALILLATGCNGIPRSEVKTVRGKVLGVLSTSTPLVAKPDETVTVTGENLIAGKSYTAIFKLTDGTTKVAPLTVVDESTATFKVPADIGLGQRDFDVTIGSRTINSFRLIVDDPSGDLSVYTGDASDICSTKVFLNKAGVKTTGTKDCATTAVECSTDGQAGCLTTQRFKAADLTLLTPSKIKSGFSVAGVSGSFDGSEDLDPWDLRRGVIFGGVTGKLYVNCRNRVNSALYNYDGVVASIPNTSVTTGTTLDYWDTIDDFNNGEDDGNGTSVMPGSVMTGWTDNDCQGKESSSGDDNVWRDVTTIGDGATASDCATTSAHCTMKDKITGLEWSKQANYSFANSSTTNGSPTLIVSSTANLVPDMVVVSAGNSPIPANTRILSIDSPTQITMTANAVAASTTATVTITTARWNGAINYCDALNHNGATDWRLPTQKELMEAYNHGMWSAASATWITEPNMTFSFWSSSSVSGGTSQAWIVTPGDGHTAGAFSSKVTTSTNHVACVR